MTSIYILLLLSLITLPVLHAILNRLEKTFKNDCSPYRNLRTVSVIMFFSSIGFLLLTQGENLGMLDLIGWMLFFLLWFFGCGSLYVLVFAASDVSMHIRILVELNLSGEISYDDLLSRYNRNVIISNRIKRMSKMEVIQIQNNHLILKAKFFVFRRAVLSYLRNLFRLGLNF